ncbi:hypothetical protein HMI56_002764 [Coelomomyces lativittatus]|nr:hypothetical protein HMI56_002764 [Coelomomyces lativittatus]
MSFLYSTLFLLGFGYILAFIIYLLPMYTSPISCLSLFHLSLLFVFIPSSLKLFYLNTRFNSFFFFFFFFPFFSCQSKDIYISIYKYIYEFYYMYLRNKEALNKGASHPKNIPNFSVHSSPTEVQYT